MSLTRRLLFGLLLALPTVAQAATFEPYGTAVLQGTDKVTGHVEKFTVPVGGDTKFGSLYVSVKACRKTPPEELPESVVFMKIEDVKPGVSTKVWYSGWMFAANPSLSALEHPVYDIAVIDCQQPLTPPEAEDQPAAPDVPANVPSSAATKVSPAAAPSVDEEN